MKKRAIGAIIIGAAMGVLYYWVFVQVGNQWLLPIILGGMIAVGCVPLVVRHLRNS